MKTRRKLVLVVLFPSVVIVSVFILSRRAIEKHRDNDFIINVLCRERASCHVVLESVLGLHERNPNDSTSTPLPSRVSAVMGLFEDTLDALQNGGPIPLNTERTVFEHRAVDVERIKGDLVELSDGWNEFTTAITGLGEDREDASRMPAVITPLGLEVTDKIDGLVAVLQLEAQHSLDRLYAVELIGFALALTALIWGFFAISRIRLKLSKVMRQFTSRSDAGSPETDCLPRSADEFDVMLKGAVELEETHTEIERRKRFEEVLQRAHNRLVGIFNATVPVCTIAVDHTILDLNDTFCTLFGVDKSRICGKKCDDVWEDRFLDQCNSLIRTILDGSNGAGCEFDSVLKDGKKVSFVANAVPCADPDGKLMGVVISLTDVTDLRRIEEELRERNEHLAAFAHTVAHDLKGTLCCMGFAQDLDRDYDRFPEKRIRETLRIISRNVTKMVSIVDNLLLLAEVPRTRINKAPLEMRAIVVEACERLATRIEESETLIIIPDDLPSAVGYAPWVEEVWVNYIGNAIKYGGTPPHVEIGADDPSDGQVRYWVKDNGPGISKELQSKLFVPFSRLGKTPIHGYGIGLSLARRIIEKLGGKVAIESEKGKGSLFIFTLPKPDD